ncbi:hypothetical protein CRUP_025081 [Coryphaenoides rupestris]|nr:hypothetical protein CRUP_025081 [Coryphaenoides rupestris]
MEKSLEAFKKDYEAASSKAGKVEAEVKRLHTLIVDINSHKLKAQRDRLDQVNRELDECTSAITKAQVAIKTAARNLKKCEETVSRLEAELEANKQAVEELTAHLKTLEEEGIEVMKACQEAEAALPEVQQQYQAVVKEIKALQQQEHALQEESLGIRLRVEQIDATIAEHGSKIKHWQKEASKLVLHAVGDKPAEALPKLTPVASRAGEELYLQRVAQLDEITTERDNFKRGYEDLRKQRLNEFMTGFNIITNKLKENYQMLTLGGDAELELVDSLDPFSEGIMFSWKKIFNLSGGEKTLSSLALVFALHHFKPTPLYFMDEIDAALDFKNVSIVACYIYVSVPQTS